MSNTSAKFEGGKTFLLFVRDVCREHRNVLSYTKECQINQLDQLPI